MNFMTYLLIKPKLKLALNCSELLVTTDSNPAMATAEAIDLEAGTRHRA